MFKKNVFFFYNYLRFKIHLLINHNIVVLIVDTVVVVCGSKIRRVVTITAGTLYLKSKRHILQ